MLHQATHPRGRARNHAPAELAPSPGGRRRIYIGSELAPQTAAAPASSGFTPTVALGVGAIVFALVAVVRDERRAARSGKW